MYAVKGGPMPSECSTPLGRFDSENAALDRARKLTKAAASSNNPLFPPFCVVTYESLTGEAAIEIATVENGRAKRAKREKGRSKR